MRAQKVAGMLVLTLVLIVAVADYLVWGVPIRDLLFGLSLWAGMLIFLYVLGLLAFAALGVHEPKPPYES